MSALKTATHTLLDQLKSAAHKPEDVYVSIVPFSKDVNFGSGNYNESWLRWDLWDPLNGTCSDNRYSKQSSCVSHGKIWTPLLTIVDWIPLSGPAPEPAPPPPAEQPRRRRVG